jgi:hypothetical protein
MTVAEKLTECLGNYSMVTNHGSIDVKAQIENRQRKPREQSFISRLPCEELTRETRIVSKRVI